MDVDKSGRVVPGRGLGSLEVGAHVQGFYSLLWDETRRRDRIEDWVMESVAFARALPPKRK